MEIPSEKKTYEAARKVAEKVFDFVKDVSTLAENMKVLADEVQEELVMGRVGVVLCICAEDEPAFYMRLGSPKGIKGCVKHINAQAEKTREQKNG